MDSEILMSNVIKKKRDYVILNFNKDLSISQLIQFRKLINERSKGKPISYLIGKKDFWKHEFKVEIKSPTFHEMEIEENDKIRMKYLLDL